MSPRDVWHIFASTITRPRFPHDSVFLLIDFPVLASSVSSGNENILDWDIDIEEARLVAS